MADWASLGVGLGGGLIGSVLGYFGQKDTNETNRQIAEQTNAQNYKIWQEQQQHNVDMFNLQNQAQIDMWNRQNDYNTASAQRQRLEDAGLNPYLMMNGGSAGVASSMNAGTAQPAQAPTMQTGAPMQSALGAGVQGFATAMDALSQAQQVALSSEELSARLPGIEYDNKNKKLAYDTGLDYKLNMLPLEKRLASVKAQIAEQTADAQIQLTNQLLEGYQLDNIIKSCDIQTKTTMNKYFDQNQQIDLARNIQGLVNDALHGRLTEKEIDAKVASISKTFAEIAYTKTLNSLGKQQYDFNEQMNPELIEGAQLDNDLKSFEKQFKEAVTIPLINATVEQYGFEFERNKLDKGYYKYLNDTYGDSDNPLFSIPFYELRRIRDYSPKVKGGFNVLGIGYDASIN